MSEHLMGLSCGSGVVSESDFHAAELGCSPGGFPEKEQAGYRQTIPAGKELAPRNPDSLNIICNFHEIHPESINEPFKIPINV